ncbi:MULTISPECIES: trifunctional serine/threonine-protein kinase/ATP-binding protein/sensor histidine kinase [Nostocales]|uniref:histidine kinase n=3 Tax=Nostocales TaxID=1161 RepID=A0A0C1QXX9_9CYAN|nr:ATP-binding sensor histidine kinase [Tolypothrix bouteillei]KAF3886375.1 AAA family ATPase [Tolypothrix bouteillei VB521301]
MVTPQITIPGYQVSEQIYNGSRTLVYRACRETDSLPVVIKLLKNPYPSFSELVQFRNQYTIAKNFNSSLIVQTYSLEPYQNGYALIVEDFGGISLKEWGVGSRERGMGENLQCLQEFLAIAIATSKILDVLYHERIIHKDIKPSNILIHPETKQIKLIDFSIASLLPRETQTPIDPNVLEGTLAYISPEQTGRMNRGIDYRTDFYSLGVTFYELLTGRLPFESNDAMELVYSHIAKKASPVNEIHPQIPSVIGEIVSKLMAKNTEERYQSALGLRFDLENCLAQLKETGEIQKFEIARWDACDRFIIPDKLYGREKEVETLLQAFERVASPGESPLEKEPKRAEMMLVAGFSGIGKTAVVNEVHKPIVRQRGYFIKGKYDQYQRNIPFSAFVQAFRDLMEQLLTESNAQIQQWKTKILKAVGENGRVITEVIPELERIIGIQPSVAELSGTAAENRFNLLFQKFTQVFTAAEHPLVIFLDDLQWADSASLKLLQLLIADTGYLFIIGAYRDNEVNPGHPFLVALKEIEKTQANIHTITLEPLSQDRINCLVADTLKCTEDLAQSLSVLVFQKTKGNPFFATQFLKALYQDKVIQFTPHYLEQETVNRESLDYERGGWQCDLTQVNVQALTDDVVAFMTLQIQKLPQSTQKILQLSACIGNQFDLATLAIVSEKSEIETATDLWKALQEGLILPTSEVYKFYQQESLVNSHGLLETNEQKTLNKGVRTIAYKFLHDRVQQAAYSLIPDDRRQSTHLKIGQLLQQNLSLIEQEEKIFDLVGHFNQGQELITQPQEREALAQLNLKAGIKARNSTAYAAARSYLQIGIDLLQPNSWLHQYELTLNLYVAAAEVAYLNADFDSMEQIAAVVLLSAQTILDKIKIYEIQIVAQVARSKMLEAIAIGREVLGQLGVELPDEAERATIDKALQTLSSQLQDRRIEELIDLPVMSDAANQAAMQLLAILFSPIIQGMPGLLPLLSAKMVSLSLEFGNTHASTMGYAAHAVVLCGCLEDVEMGYSFGKLAISLLDRFNAKKFKPMIMALFGFCIQHHREAIGAMIPTLKEGYTASMEIGDFLYAGYNIVRYLDGKFFSGVELDTWIPEIATYTAVLAKLKQHSIRTFLDIRQQIVHNLKEPVSQPDCLIGTAYDEILMMPKHHRDCELTIIAEVYICKLMLACFFGNYTSALDYISQAEEYLIAVSGFLFIPIFHFYAALTYLAIFPKQSQHKQAEMMALVETHQAALYQSAQNAPMNYLHKWYLVEAERCRVLGNKVDALEMYDRTIQLAQENGFVQDEALSHELAAKFYLDWGKKQFAQLYLTNAYYCYARWGALAKVEDLEKGYPELLATILQQPQMSLNRDSTIINLASKTVFSKKTTLSDNLDLTTVFKASQALSSEIQLEQLLSTLMQVMMVNAGADKCVLMLVKERRLTIEATARSQENHTKSHCSLQPSLPVEFSSEIPKSVINYVFHTSETLVSDDDSIPPIPLTSDPYFQREKPQSLLCTPILKQGKLIGILYLENHLTTAVFTRDRLQVLKLLTTQAAISLENAQLYRQLEDYSHTLEQKVEERTQEITRSYAQLESTLEKLYSTQSQLIQAEKMSGLGQLVAGIAHEINNPINFIYGNLEPASAYVSSLVELNNLYQKYYPHPLPEIEEKIADIELDFLVNDLQKLLKSMKVGAERIHQIVLSLRNFSRLDEAELKPVNIHSGIDSTLLILQHRLKNNSKHPEIKLIQEYGQLPLVNCYASAMNQVFMNIINNAIDALEESETNREPVISIKTEFLEPQKVQIRIADNGIGMSKSVQSQMFNPFFTTKPVGSATGLGLSISYSIVVEKHGGQLSCISTQGEGTEFFIEIPI